MKNLIGNMIWQFLDPVIQAKTEETYRKKQNEFISCIIPAIHMEISRLVPIAVKQVSFDPIEEKLKEIVVMIQEIKK